MIEGEVDVVAGIEAEEFDVCTDLLPDLFWSIAVKRRDALSHKAQRRVIRRAIASKHSG